jgi:Rnl2 family RNA ligase
MASKLKHKQLGVSASGAAPKTCFRAYPSLQPSRSAREVARSLAIIMVKSKTHAASADDPDEDADLRALSREDSDAVDALLSIPMEVVVVPKLHGSNLVLHWSPEYGTTFGRRGAFLTPTDDHYGARTAGAALDIDVKLSALFARVSALASDAEAVLVYGEVYGGLYPHPDVLAAKPSRKPVQKGIWYSPTVNIAMFDVAVVEKGRARFLNFDDAMIACTLVGIPFVSPAFRGSTLLEACAWAVEHAQDDALAHFNPARLPLLGADKNAGEGFVVRPATEHAWGSVNANRALAKVKNPRFTEVNDAPSSASASAFTSCTDEGNEKSKGKAKGSNDPTVAAALVLADRLLNAARAASVASKMSSAELVIKNVKAFAHALAEDALQEPTLAEDIRVCFPPILASGSVGQARNAFERRAMDVARAFLQSI